MRRRWPGFASAMLVLGAWGCGADADANTHGKRLFREPLEDGNSFACASCHALEEPAADGLRRPGHPLGDATRRPSYKNGRYERMLDAVNTCIEHWMNGEPWSEADPRWEELFAFLDAQAPSGPAPAVSFTVTAPPADPSGGDEAAGRALFNSSCAVCHGEHATGTRRAPPLAGGRYGPEYVAERVRTSGRRDNPAYDGLTGGIMPFWSAERLSDAELRDLVAYVTGLEDAPGDPPSMRDGGVPSTDAGGECDRTHVKVGQTAVLEERFHGVRGTATVADDCTILVEDFHYDGRGIVVQFYGGLGGDYDAGFALGGDLVRDEPYEGDTIVLRLPDGRSLGDLDGLSVWCVEAGVSFGDGMFEG